MIVPIVKIPRDTRYGDASPLTPFREPVMVQYRIVLASHIYTGKEYTTAWKSQTGCSVRA